MYKRIIIGIIIQMCVNSLVSAQGSQWQAPESADTLKNTFVHGDQPAIASGKELFETICNLCHGDIGKGDGIQAPALARLPADLTSGLVQQQSDGKLFWKISEGNDVMLSFSYFSEEQRWQLVTYIRELAKLYPPEKSQEKEIIAAAETTAAGKSNAPDFFEGIGQLNGNILVLVSLALLVFVLVLVMLVYTVILLRRVKADIKENS